MKLGAVSPGQSRNQEFHRSCNPNLLKVFDNLNEVRAHQEGEIGDIFPYAYRRNILLNRTIFLSRVLHPSFYPYYYLLANY